MATTYDAIATTTLGSAASSITFSSIAASWTDLRLVFVKPVGGSSLLLRFNSDTATNYSWTYLVGDGASVSSSYSTSDTSITVGGYVLNLASGSVLGEIDIFSYAGSTYKTTLSALSHDMNGTGQVARTVGLWRSTSAITSVNIRSGSNWPVGTTATLYGIKAA
tara:strand:+ start:29 stop:520 length:492 start_codon:yes stop_codon:yes gene_type:complete